MGLARLSLHEGPTREQPTLGSKMARQGSTLPEEACTRVQKLHIPGFSISPTFYGIPPGAAHIALFGVFHGNDGRNGCKCGIAGTGPIHEGWGTGSPVDC